MARKQRKMEKLKEQNEKLDYDLNKDKTMSNLDQS